MASYLKEGEPVEENDKINIDKIVEEFDEDYKNRFSNLIYAESISSYYPDFKKIIHLPNNDKITKPLNVVLEEFIKNCTDRLEYYLSIKVVLEQNTVNIFVVPIVESA